jgi:hypothetical protein
MFLQRAGAHGFYLLPVRHAGNGLGWGYFLACQQNLKPNVPIAFIDGQNLFYSAKNAFGHMYPNYDVLALAASLCKARCWQLEQVRFYSGIPDAADDAF